jgi:photosystem II stability/assembly factor-like uncharacterized protein
MTALEARVLFEPRVGRYGADSIVVDGARAFAIAGDKGHTEIYVITDLATHEIRKVKPKTWLRGVLAEGPDWFAGGERGQLLRSPDQGKTWVVHQLPTDQPICSVVRHEGVLWVAGANGFLAHEAGGGWSTVDHEGGTNAIAHLHLVNGALYIVGMGLCQITDRRVVRELPRHHRLTALAATARGTRIALGEDGRGFRSERGRAWKPLALGDQDLVGLVDIGPALIAARKVAFSHDALILTSIDDGKTFQPLRLLDRDGEPRRGDRIGCTCVAPDGRGGVLIAGYQGLLIHVSRSGSSRAATRRPTSGRRSVSVSVTVLSDQLRPQALASDGARLHVVDGANLGWFVDGASMTWRSLGERQVEAIAIDRQTLWACGAGVWRSKLGGQRWVAQEMPRRVDPTFWGRGFHGIAVDPGGTWWAGGHHVIRARPGMPWTAVRELGEDARVKAVCASPLGALLLTFTGQLWFANGTELRRARVTGADHLSGALVTATGALLVVGSGRRRWSGFAARSTTQGRSFTSASLPADTPPLLSIATLPDRRIIVGGEGGTLLSSVDDGVSFQRLVVPNATPMRNAPNLGYSAMCSHGEAVYAGGPTLPLVRIE